MNQVTNTTTQKNRNGDYTVTVRTDCPDYISSEGDQRFSQVFRVLKINRRWAVKPVDRLVWGDQIWDCESLKQATERCTKAVKRLILPHDNPKLMGLSFHRNSGGFLCYSGQVDKDGQTFNVYVSRPPASTSQWNAQVSPVDPSPLDSLTCVYEHPFPIIAAQKALENAADLMLRAKEAQAIKVLALEVPQEESEPLPFSEPPLDEEDTLEMTPVTDAAPSELPEDIQGAIGYLQQLIEDLEAGKRDTLTDGQAMTLQAALSWVAYDKSSPREVDEEEDDDLLLISLDYEEEDEPEDEDWFDDYPDKVCPHHFEEWYYSASGIAVCATCGERE